MIFRVDHSIGNCIKEDLLDFCIYPDGNLFYFLVSSQNCSESKRKFYILTTFIEVVYIVMSTVGIVKGVQKLW